MDSQQSAGPLSSQLTAGLLGSEGRREAWEVGSVLECFSASVRQWYPARIMQVELTGDGEVLTVQFTTDDGPKVKSTYRSDTNLTVFGTHLHDKLPPGFEKRPSQSRPGTSIFFDATTGKKYADSELAWRVHLERLFQQPAAGMQTVHAVPSSNGGTPCRRGSPSSQTSSQMQQQPQRPYFDSEEGYGGGPSGRGSPSSQMQNQSQRPYSDSEEGYGGNVPQFSTAAAAADPRAKNTIMASASLAAANSNGKVSLPSFGDFNGRQSNQAAYLGYVGSQCGNGSYQSGEASLQQRDDLAQYPTPARVRVPHSQQPPVRARNPALQVWQEDPFSEWRA
jgi:hypothetical protein